jgi:hypothetical protein
VKSIYESSTRELMKQFITSENIQKGEKFNREKIRNWFNKNYPKLKPGTIDAHINSMTINARTRIYSILINIKFNLNYSIKNYLISYLRRQEIENKKPTLDDIVLNIMPLLKNGVTPEHQTILNVLKDIAVHEGLDHWQLNKNDQMSLFNL